MRKIIGLALCLYCILPAAHTQILKDVFPSQHFTENLNLVIADFKFNYQNIQGEALLAEGSGYKFKSLIDLPGANESVIYRFNSKKDSAASWQAVLFKGEDYNEALKIYRKSSRMLNKCRVQTQNSQAGFSGKLEEPSTNLTFAVSTFTLNTDDALYKNFFAEIEMVNTEFSTWEVRLNLHNKKPDEDK